MGQRLLTVLAVATTGCGRIGFDATVTSDALPPAPLWATVIGGDRAGRTTITDVFEDTAGDLLVVGTARNLPSSYLSGTFVKLDGILGTIVVGGVRDFEGTSENHLNAALAVGDGVLAIGMTAGLTPNFQHAFGVLSNDGAWSEVWRSSGGLTHPGIYDSFHGGTALAAGGWVFVGHTQLGTGSCPSCALGTDALVVKVRPDRTIEWARAYGDAYGDEVFGSVVEVPGGDLIVLGRSLGERDYSLGAGTNVDSAPALTARLSPAGDPVWAHHVRAPLSRQSQLLDGRYDATSSSIVVTGTMGFATTPIVARLNLDGTYSEIVEVVMDGLNGHVSNLELADDGGLYIVGFELEAGTTRSGFVAKLGPARDNVEWARRVSLDPDAANDSGLRRSRRGDLIAWWNGVGAQQQGAVILRIGADGSSPDCFPLAAAALTLVPQVDMSIPVTPIITDVVAPTFTQVAGVEVALPADSTVSCSP